LVYGFSIGVVDKKHDQTLCEKLQSLVVRFVAMFDVEREVICERCGRKYMVWVSRENLEGGFWEKESYDEHSGM